ncbi:hypothetical protein ADL03_31355 [Nocardia sp. NRRL S-836]|nr:hypothetical protein ADL03_31355 [Nocardia sp. NRRL S-836]
MALAGSGSPASQPAVAGKEVCAGKPLEFMEIGGPAGVLSDRFPTGTSLRVTNVANGRTITVPVVGTAAKCALLNNAAFEALRSPDAGRGAAETVLRRARVEIVGNAPAPMVSSLPRVRASGVVGSVVCDGASVGLSDVGGEATAFSSQLPVGTVVRVTNLDSGRQVTVRVVGVGNGCVVLNRAAFALVGESGENVVKRAQIEQVR